MLATGTETASRQRRIPKLKYHKPSRQYLVSLPTRSGKPEYVYLGKDQTAAERQYQALIVRTFGQPQEVGSLSGGDGKRTAQTKLFGQKPRGMFPDLEIFSPNRVQAAPAKKGAVTVNQAKARLLSQIVAPSVRDGNTRDVDYRLTHFTDKFGERSIADIDLPELLDWRKDMAAKFSAATTNHAITETRRLLRYATGMGWRAPLQLDMLKGVPTPAPKDKSWKPDKLKAVLGRCLRNDPYLYCWMSVGFLTLTRPSETYRMMADILTGQECWHEEGIYLLQSHKTATKSKLPRYIPVCPTAMALIERAKREKPLPLCMRGKGEGELPWGDWNAYSKGCGKASGEAPHPLRHTSATLLIRSGTARSTVDEMLGHQPPNGRVSIIYMHDGAMQGWRTEAEAKLTNFLPKA